MQVEKKISSAAGLWEDSVLIFIKLAGTGDLNVRERDV